MACGLAVASLPKSAARVSSAERTADDGRCAQSEVGGRLPWLKQQVNLEGVTTNWQHMANWVNISNWFIKARHIERNNFLSESHGKPITGDP